MPDFATQLCWPWAMLTWPLPVRCVPGQSAQMQAHRALAAIARARGDRTTEQAHSDAVGPLGAAPRVRPCPGLLFSPGNWALG